MNPSLRDTLTNVKKISIVVHDLSKNGIVRVYPIAKVLQRHFEIEIVGFCFQDKMFPIYVNEFTFKIFKCSPNIHKFMLQIPKAIKRIDGDIIYAFKPRVSSLGVALMAKLIKRRPVIMDNEDWEGEYFYMAKTWKERLGLLKISPLSVDNPFYRGLMEKAISLADEVTVVSSFLENRSGGKRLVHGADCDLFNPEHYDRAALREQWGVRDKFVVLFAGTIFPHKGLEEIIDAFRLLNDDRFILMVVGVDNPHVKSLKAYAKEKLLFVGPHPHNMMPNFLSLSDLVILNNKDTPHAQAQIPGKIFEAMAMEKVIIASKVSDLPEILNECGMIIEKNTPAGIAEALKKFVLNPDLVKDLGKKSRQKCVEYYSWDAMDVALKEIFSNY